MVDEIQQTIGAAATAATAVRPDRTVPGRFAWVMAIKYTYTS